MAASSLQHVGSVRRFGASGTETHLTNSFFFLPYLLVFSFFIPSLSVLPLFFPTSSFFHLFLASPSLSTSLENSFSSPHVSRMVTVTSFPLSLGDCGYGERPHTARKLRVTSAGSTAKQTTS